MDKDLQRCLDLLRENEDQMRNDAESVLISILDNILTHKNNEQYRKVQLDDSTVIEKLLPAVGAMECLFDIGFVEAADCLVLPQNASLLKLKALHCFLTKRFSMKTNPINNSVAYNLLPPTTTPKERTFFIDIIKHFQNVLRYEDVNLQEKARKLIPITDFEMATVTKIREIQRHLKLNNRSSEEDNKKQCNDSVISTEDLFLMELLHWFKCKFFTWIDSPRCSACFGNCKYHKVIPSEDPKCSRIEIHKCTNCESLVKFPRYSDPETLLTLRCGRCGEWAIVFTLFCRTLGYDARFIHDQTDHVWTEVWSMHKNRWIHVDPCEDAMDQPLMYEKGWKKKLSYIIAFSKDEVQDVTWRYTRDQIGVMKRRNICSENNLLKFIESLNKQRQFSPNFSASRRQYVIKRRLLELVELIHMPKAQNSDNDESYHERSSGSYEWKLARGEITQTNSKANYSWDISKHGQSFQLQYSVIEDTYQVMDDNGKILVQLSGWQNGVNEINGEVFRKVENDWKMVYLARSPGNACSKIKWNFIVTNPNLYIWTITLKAMVTVFHEANISWEIEAFFENTDESKSFIIPINQCINYNTDQFKGSMKLILTATMSDGQGDFAWQHAQLFRQSLENKGDQSLVINIQLKNR